MGKTTGKSSRMPLFVSLYGFVKMLSPQTENEVTAESTLGSITKGQTGGLVPGKAYSEKFALESHSCVCGNTQVSPERFWLLVEIHQEIRAHGFGAELTQQSCYLAPMVTGMVDHVDELPPERIGIALTFLVDVSQLFA